MPLRPTSLLASACGVLATTLCLSVAQAQAPSAHAERDRVPILGAPAGVTAFIDVGVIPMDRERLLADQTVLIRDGRIITLGPANRVRVPVGATQIDGHGKFLIPGLSDMHAHLVPGPHVDNRMSSFGMMPESAPNADSAGTEARLFLWLANGVTTVRDMDYYDESWGRQALLLRARAAAGREWLPHIYTAGEWGPKQYIGFADSPAPVLDSIATYVAAYKAAGYDFIKVHNESPIVLDSVLAAARRVGIPVVGHVPPPSRIEHVLPLGYRSIEHPMTDYLWNQRTQPASPDTAGFAVVAGAMRRAGVWHCPTEQHYDRWHFAPPPLLKIEQDSGVKLLVGTDEVPWQGVIARELRAFVDAGLTPYQALVAGTRNVAEYFGTLSDRGTVAVGKRADLVLLTGNPLQDIRYAAQPAGVMLGGRWLSRAEMDRRIATLTLPVHAAGEPVKSYWSNTLDEIVQSATSVLHDLKPTDAQRATFEKLHAMHKTQRQALVDSLGENDQYTASTQRVLGLLAHEIGEYRTDLTPEQRTQFDRQVGTWTRRWRAKGYAVAVPGVQS